MIYFFGCCLLVGFVLWLSILYIDAKRLKTIFFLWCRILNQKCSTFKKKILNYMQQSVNYHRYWLWLVVALFMIFALSMASCKTRSNAVRGSASLRVTNQSTPEIQTLSGKWIIPRRALDSLAIHPLPLSVVDTAAKVGLSLSDAGGGALTIETFAFVPKPFSLPNIEVAADASASGGQTETPWRLLIIVWVGSSLALILVARLL